MFEDQWEPVWDQWFSDRDGNRYPPEELVRFIARNFGQVSNRRDLRILDAGCGCGANLWYLAREGFSAAGIDGSEVAIQRAGTRLASEGLAAELRVGDINRLSDFYPAGQFDAVIDLACLQHAAQNPRPVLDQIRTLLKPGGLVFSMLVARGTWGEGTGRELGPGTFTEITEGPYAGVGRLHFFTREEVAALFEDFVGVSIESLRRTADNGTRSIDHWLATASIA